MNGFDQEIVQDFLTESGELLEQLDKDLVLLEKTPRDPDLLNQVFRALHTIKGSASFLQLTNLVQIAHVAEGTLNAARAGTVLVDKRVMDLLLEAVDVLKKQFEDLTAGRDLTKADAGLVASLTEISEGKGAGHGSHDEPAPAATAPVAAPAAVTAVPTTTSASTSPAALTSAPLKLPDNKAILVEFLITDLRETIAKAETAAAMLVNSDTRMGGASQLAEQAEALLKSAQFFEFDVMTRLCTALNRAANASCTFNDDCTAQFLPRVYASLALLVEQTEGLAKNLVVSRPIDGLCASMDALASGNPAADATAVLRTQTAGSALLADGVVSAVSELPEAAMMPVSIVPGTVPAGVPSTPEPAASTLLVSPSMDPVPSVAQRKPEPAPPAPSAAPAAQNTSAAQASQAQPAGENAAGGASAQMEQTIRVEVGRLEALLNLVGELVLQKNRLTAISRSATSTGVGSQDFREGFTLAAGSLDRVTSDIQVAVMRTRMQPLDKLFGKYPRLIRDLSRKTGKDIRLEIIGGETEVDKSVIEELGDPLVHIMRNSADHGLETPEQRKASGKSEHGTITLAASHEGSHVQIKIMDDGRGLSRDRIGRKAVERGIATEQEVARMSDRDVHQFIFAAGFSTAEKVTDLSGRGVGMDVVRTNIEKIKGSIELQSTEGKGTTIIIKIPLTVAILTAMMVDIGSETYAVPLSSITEIVKPVKEQMSSVHGRPVLRLRETVLPLLDGCSLFSLPKNKCKPTPFAVIVQSGEKLAGLMVSRLIGQQEVVIKPLDGVVEQSGPVSGATVRDDGGVSLIVDVNQMVALAERAATGGWGDGSTRGNNPGYLNSSSSPRPEPALVGG